MLLFIEAKYGLVWEEKKINSLCCNIKVKLILSVLHFELPVIAFAFLLKNIKLP
jgi:hypothetical protein